MAKAHTKGSHAYYQLWEKVPVAEVKSEAKKIEEINALASRAENFEKWVEKRRIAARNRYHAKRAAKSQKEAP